jgi:acyl-CoA reductase-like NAD-dependent aldehyde dehydrogenase
MTNPFTVPEQRDLIDGHRQRAAIATADWLTNPSTGERLAPIRESDPEHIERAISAAGALHRSRRWSTSTVATRSDLLHRIADGVAAQSEDIAQADAFDSGVPISVTRMFADGLSDVIRGAIEHLEAARLDRHLPGAVRPVRQRSAGTPRPGPRR